MLILFNAAFIPDSLQAVYHALFAQEVSTKSFTVVYGGRKLKKGRDFLPWIY